MESPFADPRRLLKQFGLHAKKSWGQNFLISDRVYRAIVDATINTASDWVVEFGAGLGTLTERLADRAPEGKIFAVERDRDLVAVLQSQFQQIEGVEILEQNALTCDLAPLAQWYGDPITVCGNLPYNIASQILVRIIDSRVHVARAVVMLQREVAERLLACPGSKDYGALGVLVQTFSDVELIVRARPGAFFPAPKVESAVVRLRLLENGQPRHAINDIAHYRSIVRLVFTQRRKMLRTTLRTAFPEEAVITAAAESELDLSRRAETLSIAEFARLANALPPRDEGGAVGAQGAP